MLDKVADGRQQPRTPTTLILQSALAMFWAHVESLNSLETLSTARFWKRWLAGDMVSADTMGRVHAVLDVGPFAIYEGSFRSSAKEMVNLGKLLCCQGIMPK